MDKRPISSLTKSISVDRSAAICYSSLDKKAKRSIIFEKKKRFLRANGQIRFSPVIVIDETGQNIGSIPTEKALGMAYEKGFDLVEINPMNKPPICKIMDFGKFKYDQAKKEKEAKAHSKATELKEMRLTFKISSHDIEYKAKQAKEFFDRGDAVKVSMRLRGRENAFPQQAYQVFQNFADVANLSYERYPQKSGNQITAFMTAKKEEKK